METGQGALTGSRRHSIGRSPRILPSKKPRAPIGVGPEPAEGGVEQGGLAGLFGVER